MKRFVALFVVLLSGMLAPANGAARTAGETQRALHRLGLLQVAAPLPLKGFGQRRFRHWLDPDGNGCNARQDTLIRDGTLVTRGPGCAILSGTWFDQYSGRTYRDVRSVEVDHLVPLANAWRSGARGWTTARRAQFANDPIVLVTTSTRLDRQKRERSPDQWKPPRRADWFTYAARWIRVKAKYHLTVTRAERAALRVMLRAAPASATAPVISGRARVGSKLTATGGSWTGSPPPTITRQWRRCTGPNCVNIAGATGFGYLLVGADAGQRVQVVATATNSAGSATATSAQTATIGAAPATSVLPGIAGTPNVGSTLTATNGTWSGSPAPTFTRQWQRCAATSCIGITGATGSSYLLAAADAGQRMQVVVTATNNIGTRAATSAQTATISAAPATLLLPAVSAAPAIAGTTTVGSTLTATDGTWSGSPPPALTRQWQRCASSCVNIAAATAPSYPLVAADAGQKVQVVVTATNIAGAATATSAQTAKIGAVPANLALPTISGTARVGSRLTATNGTWSGTPAPTFTRQWQRCTAAICVDIAGATGTTYTLAAADAGQEVQVVVTATNTAGSSDTASAQTVTIAPATSAGDPTIATAGDIACDPASSDFNGGAGSSTVCAQRAVSNLIFGKGFASVLPLGDNQYYCGGLTDFQQSYDLSWGRLLSITHPVVGNHEYVTTGGTGCDGGANASGYFSYFGSRAGTPGEGYYSYDVGTWHVIALNSNCGNVGGCSASSPQGRWLTADLAAHRNACTLAYWHIPLFSSGGRAASNSGPFWTALYNAGAEVILNGHDHIYERFAPQTPDGIRDDARGLREFIAGTGGANHTSLVTVAANSELQNTNTFGILKLTLHAGSYDWQFIPAAGTGTFTDSGSQACH